MWQMLAGGAGAGQQPTEVGASTRAAPQNAHSAAAGGAVRRGSRGASPSAGQRAGARGISPADPHSAGLLEEALRDYPPEEAAHWRSMLQ